MLGKKLKTGDTIGIISPSSPENPKSIEKAINFFENRGFKIKLGKHVYDKRGYLAGEDKDRANDIMDMFKDDTVDMILCVRGGYGSMRTLPYIDFEVIRNNPKIFVGFSDITSFLNTFYSKSGLVTFHGPMFTSNFDDKYTIDSFFNTLMNGDVPYRILNPSSIELSCAVEGEAKGHLVGGNLSLISNTLGTPYEIDFKNNILFIEDVHEEPYAIDRMLTHIELSGKLKTCSGFILGQFKNCTLPHYERSLTLEEVFKDKIFSLNKPTLTHFMSGHDYPKLTLPIGVPIYMNSTQKVLQITHPVVSK
ncbi:muramoyltetrapeptide carboxypeptidase [Clostridium acetobutylicum]|uniref:MccF-like protein n=1 Tax=Clostridium acetobutylicum (strain ATCC 824 / DSM 792 / JCM 1419 / IAM 19013 / LMG 5710 / NBRC 13948 / NRRL B-527 / VKM B-1787 / 2291 / W) TaxID=272562 RepID=Q97MA5_CLOAB|nr:MULTISPECIES: LD-carboxypeptidase [Clostridium]AAK78274.1 MccF-like protein [Clostridium acetobutylicum ATCC 824]ADZ19341.1 MccF-like protein [Clostridium acetobutylicum EA 2018]AEI31153.1 MccF-like protein [Clostridium acetobutylicum DSM 1731]AWV80000.1 LD-carboxypeptidase [Clostridium acetobutylicum]MBC2395816.1 LD-carboxypeptidase [Clostridium acetobutylicum]